MLIEHGVTYCREKVNDRFYHELIYICFKDGKMRESTIWIEADNIQKAVLNLNQLCYYWTSSGYQYYVKPFVRY